MKKIIAILILVMIFLTGCTIPEDDVILLIPKLNTIEKISDFMHENFYYKAQLFGTKSPQRMLHLGYGDCNDYSNFAAYMAHYNGIEVWQIQITWKHTLMMHFVSVYYVTGNYYLMDNWRLYNKTFETLHDAVLYDCVQQGQELNHYWIYEWNLQLIEKI